MLQWAQEMREMLERQRIERELKMEEEKKRKREEEEKKGPSELGQAQKRQHTDRDHVKKEAPTLKPAAAARDG